MSLVFRSEFNFFPILIGAKPEQINLLAIFLVSNFGSLLRYVMHKKLSRNINLMLTNKVNNIF